MFPFLHIGWCRSGVVALASAAAGVAWGQSPGFDAVETETALRAALVELKEARANLAAEKEAAGATAAKLGAVTAELAAVRDELAQLKLRIEALGPVTDTRGLEKRVLDALSDLRIARAEAGMLDSRLKALAEAATSFLVASEEQKASLRPALEAALEAARTESADTGASAPVRIESSQVVSVKPEQRLVVINAGQRSGMKVGTPVRIYRNDRPTASAVVVDVRANISGGLVTKVEDAGFPKVGDTLRIDVRPEN
jgi:hypothetical protein